jgi:hypothetical protein
MSSTSAKVGIDDHWVYIKLANDPGPGNAEYNRIALKCESVAISTGKTVGAFPVPFSGMATGESLSLALDLGMASKTINLTGVITEQTIFKRFEEEETTSIADEDEGKISKRMTAQEVAQTLHSYVDSSFVQSQQNLNELIILYPSFVSKQWDYHSGITSTTNIDDAKMMPFNWAVRDAGTISGLDAQDSIGGTSFPAPITTSTESVEGIKGFIRTFNTTFTGGNPFVEFTMDFEVAVTIGF